MKNINEIIKILQEHKLILIEQFKIKEIGIFGSYVKGQQKKGSDIDVLVEFCKPVGLFAFLDLEEYLGKLFGTKVDLVSKKALKPQIGRHILEEVVSV